uniref:MucR family transcriptional regulator n=1 Tax=Sphingomonas sp. 35-24ZXX TaxID=1545915 RepID=UPI0018CD4CE3
MTEHSQEQLITLTADIVAAHIGNNSVALGDIATLIANVHTALAGLSSAEVPEPQEVRPEPAVSIRSSIKHD